LYAVHTYLHKAILQVYSIKAQKSRVFGNFEGKISSFFRLGQCNPVHNPRKKEIFLSFSGVEGIFSRFITIIPIG